MVGIWHEIRSVTLRNGVLGAFLFCNAKNNMFARRYELTQPTIWKITNIGQNLKMLDTETPFKLQFDGKSVTGQTNKQTHTHTRTDARTSKILSVPTQKAPSGQKNRCFAGVPDDCPEGAFCVPVGTLKFFDVRASVRPSVRPYVRTYVPSRSCNQFEFKLDLVAANLDLNSI